jgi:hypothetical protein
LADKPDGTLDEPVAGHTSRYHLHIIKLQSSSAMYTLSFYDKKYIEYNLIIIKENMLVLKMTVFWDVVPCSLVEVN